MSRFFRLGECVERLLRDKLGHTLRAGAGLRARIYSGPRFQPGFTSAPAPMPPKESVDLVIEPRWVLPIAPVNTALGGYGVVVTSGRIVAVAPRAEVNELFEPRERILRPDHALLPGFVNAHTRAATTLLRGLPVYGPRARWMGETVLPVARRCMSPDFVREGTQLAIAEMLRSGITALGDMYWFPEEAARAAAAARMRASIGLPVADGHTVWADGATGHLAKAEQIWDEYQSHPSVSLYFAPHNPLSDPTLARVRRIADELDARVAMYLAPDDMPVGGLRHLQDLGLLGPGFTAIQLSELEEHELEIAATTGLSVIACPQSHLRLGSGVCPITALDERKVCVGLGTDSAVSVGALDVLAEARMAALLTGLNGVGALAARTVLRMATLGGAHALGMSAVAGSIEAGKAADLVCIDLSTLACQPVLQPAEAIVFGATREQVSDVWTSGRAAVRDGHLLTFDEPELRALARRWSERIPTGEMT